MADRPPADPPLAATTPAAELLDRAESAFRQHRWEEAFGLLRRADAEAHLGPMELDLLAQAAWWMGRLPVAIETHERAYAAATAADDAPAAVTAALRLARAHLMRNAVGVAGGWLDRAQRLLAGLPENPGHAWMEAMRSFHSVLAGDAEAALEHASRSYEISVRLGDRDAEATALSEKGAALLSLGRVTEGLALVDEATAAAVGGDLDPSVAGGVYCTAIETCAALGEWGRATEWIEAQDRWCRREGINGFPGLCRLFRGNVKLLRGAWPEAEAEARRAADELPGYIPAAVGQALYQIGEIRLRRGDLLSAEEALLNAHSYGHDGQPALALLRLAQGKPSAAAASIREALEEPGRYPSWRGPAGSDLYRLSLLPAQAEIALAAGDLAGARRAADELSALASRFDSVAAQARLASTLGMVLTAEGDATQGARELRRAVRLWVEVDAPYEAARARMALGDAYQHLMEPERATEEWQAARQVFERLGARPDLNRAEELIARAGAGSRPGTGEAATRAFMFTDIVDSTKLTEALGDEAWERLVRWHDQLIRSLAAEHGGQEVKGTGDGLFLTFDDLAGAVDCAVAIQRRLVEQREHQGFAPSVRIGIHHSEARRVGTDYVGAGVNLAARVGAAAAGGEVLVSAEALAGAPPGYPERERRTVTLKGVSGPVEVVSVDWR